MAFTEQFILYMWISFYCFLFAFIVILSAKLIQYFRRWGNTRANNIDYEKTTIDLIYESMSLSLDAMNVKPSNDSNGKIILLISPFTVSIKRYVYLATAFALNGYEIVLISGKKCSTFVQKQSITVEQFSKSLLNKINPIAVIGSDVSFPIMLPKMLQTSNTAFIMLRPLLLNRSFHPIITFTLTIPWVSNLILIFQQIIQQDIPKLESRTLLIFPRIFMRKPIIIKSTNNLTIKQIRSRFSFRDKETLVFSYILQFIHETSV